jgi:hypothetical protein
MFDADAEAAALLRSQGFDPASPPPPYFLACGLLGSAHVVRVPGLRVRARWTGHDLHVRDGLPRTAESYLIAHELAEYVLGRRLLQDELIEQRCDELAAALLAPAAAVRRALAVCGRSLPLLAEGLGTTQSIALLRLGEVTGTPLALVTPAKVHVRGSEYGWPGEAQLRVIAGHGTPVAGLERSVLTDAPRRVALLAG